MPGRLVSIRALLFGLAIFLGMNFVALAEKTPPSKPIDLNVANLKELQELPGVGAVTAQRIIDLRQKSGRFHRVEDLLAVRGISPKKLDAMRKYITVSAAPAASAAPVSNPPAKKTAPPAKAAAPCTGCGATKQ
jgi:competence ComEA-like helix-hairpin-helix protein